MGWGREGFFFVKRMWIVRILYRVEVARKIVVGGSLGFLCFSWVI